LFRAIFRFGIQILKTIQTVVSVVYGQFLITQVLLRLKFGVRADLDQCLAVVCKAAALEQVDMLSKLVQLVQDNKLDYVQAEQAAVHTTGTVCADVVRLCVH
jgi:hypothetical protein